jgi:hypothetical protein
LGGVIGEAGVERPDAPQVRLLGGEEEKASRSRCALQSVNGRIKG